MYTNYIWDHGPRCPWAPQSTGPIRTFVGHLSSQLLFSSRSSSDARIEQSNIYESFTIDYIRIIYIYIHTLTYIYIYIYTGKAPLLESY